MLLRSGCKLAVVLATLVASNSIFGQKPAQNPADFPISVHVTFSRSITGSSVTNPTHQQLEAIINGQEVELSGGGLGVLAVADYPARTAKQSYVPRKHFSYDLFNAYELLMPDGQVRKYEVIGLGAASPHP